MSVIIWCERFYPEIGGLEKAMFCLYEKLNQNNIDVKILTCSKYDRKRINTKDIVYFSPVDFINASLQYLDHYADSFKLLYISRIFQQDEDHHIDSLKYLPKNISVCLRAPTTYSLKHLKKSQHSIIDSIVDVIITLNDKSYKICRKIFNNTDVLKFSNSTDIPSYFSINFQSYFLFSGRITPSKNLYNLIKCWEIINKRCFRKKPILKIYGIPYHPQYYEKCMRLIERTQNVMYCGAYSPGNLTIIDNASFVVIPSYREGHSNLMNEAYSCGTPIISSSIYGLFEHNCFDNNLIVFAPNDIEELARAIIYSWEMAQLKYISISKEVRKYALQYFNNDEQVDFLIHFLLNKNFQKTNMAY